MNVLRAEIRGRSSRSSESMLEAFAKQIYYVLTRQQLSPDKTIDQNHANTIVLEAILSTFTYCARLLTIRAGSGPKHLITNTNVFLSMKLLICTSWKWTTVLNSEASCQYVL